MARVKFSSLLNSIDGSVGGTTFQRNKSGNTVRSKPLPVNHNSLKVIETNNFLAIIQNAWRAMSDNERNEWVLFANYNPVGNIHNRNVNLSGYQLFVKYNLLRLTGGYTLLTTITYGVYNSLSTSLEFWYLNHELAASLDSSFNGTVNGVVLHASSPKYTGYPVLAKSYKVISPDEVFETYLFLTQSYFAQYAMVPGLGLYIPYKLVFFHLTMPVMQIGQFNIGLIVSPP